jgi:hypothetical protein
MKPKLLGMQVPMNWQLTENMTEWVKYFPPAHYTVRVSLASGGAEIVAEQDIVAVHLRPGIRP